MDAYSIEERRVQYDSSTTAVDAVTREGGGALVRKKKEEQSCSTEKCIKRVWVARATAVE